MTSELEKLYSHIDDIEIAMMTTRRADGHLQSRAMATQRRAAGADLWFVTLEGAQKLRDIGEDPHVNLSYYKDRTREWISVSGIASLTRDEAAARSALIDVERYDGHVDLRGLHEGGLWAATSTLWVIPLGALNDTVQDFANATGVRIALSLNFLPTPMC